MLLRSWASILALILILAAPAQADEWILYKFAEPVPAELETGLERIEQPNQAAKGCARFSVACVPTTAQMALNDRGWRKSTDYFETIINRYTPAVLVEVLDPATGQPMLDSAGKPMRSMIGGGTKLWSAARELDAHNIKTNYYLPRDIKLDTLFKVMEQGRSTIINYVDPSRTESGHAIMGDKLVTYNKTAYIILRDPSPGAPFGGKYMIQYLRVADRIDAFLEIVEGKGGPAEPHLDPQRPRAGGPFNPSPEANPDDVTDPGIKRSTGGPESEAKPGRCARAISAFKQMKQAWHDWLDRKLGINNDLSKLSPTRQFVNGTVRGIGLGLAVVAVAKEAAALKSYFDHIAAATDEKVTDADAQRHYEAAHKLALGMIDSGKWAVAWAALWEVFPPGAAILTGFTVGYAGGQYLLVNPHTGKVIEKAAGGFFDWIFGAKDDGGDLLSDAEARKLLEAYDRAIAAGHIRLKQGATREHLEHAVRRADMFQIHSAIIEAAPAPGCVEEALPQTAQVWVRTGPFIKSGDGAVILDETTSNPPGEAPSIGNLTVSGTRILVLSYRTGRQNTLTWSAPPAELTVGGPDSSKAEVSLTLAASTDQEGPLVGGWWNINCEAAGKSKGDKSAGSKIGYRLSGSPDPHNATYAFRFAPSRDPYIQLSAGNDFHPKLWVLVTYKYVSKPATPN